MTRVAKLTSDAPEFDRIKSLEAEHEQIKVTIQLAPLYQFVIEAGIQSKLHLSRSGAVRQLLEAAALDFLEAKGYQVDSDEFREKYLKWLTRKPYLTMVPTGRRDEYGDPEMEEEEVYETVTL